MKNLCLRFLDIKKIFLVKNIEGFFILILIMKESLLLLLSGCYGYMEIRRLMIVM